MAAHTDGSLVMMVDRKNRRFLLDLKSGKTFSTHRGTISHDEIIGAPIGQTYVTNMGDKYVAMTPRLADYVLLMKRGAQIVYPKDAAAILVQLDVRPGSRVFEAGTGSGALTLFLLDAVGPTGSVTSVDRRQDHADIAKAVIERWHGEIPDNLDLRVGDAEEMISEVQPDRIMLDMPEPWQTIEAVAPDLSGGATICAYVPTVPQVESTVRALRFAKRFADIGVFEVLHRDWNVDGRSVRPSHRMVGHTGFLITARCYEPAEELEPETTVED
jgi:tRNA (adenine57-N1/adenine58-N1)-methyltransferase